MRLLILIILALLLLPDLYIWALFVRHWGWVWRLAWWLPALAAVAAAWIFSSGAASQRLLGVLFFLVVAVGVPKLLFALVSLTGRAAAWLWSGAPHAADTAGAAVAALLAAVFVYGFTAGWKQLTVRQTTIEFDDLPPAFDGYRIVHLSDLHVGTYGTRTRFVERLVARINALDADAVMFTGDLINSSADETAPFAGLLAALRARDGVFSVIGNHDYSEYRRWEQPDGAARSLARLEQAQREWGWQLLLNEHRLVVRGGDTLAVVGVENTAGRHAFTSRGDLGAACRGIPDGMFKILLSHDPSHWRREVLPAGDIRLTLSGHTHAMQFRIGRFSPSAWIYDEWGGLYGEQGCRLHVSTGAGGTAPFRFGAWPCIDLITLKRKP